MIKKFLRSLPGANGLRAGWPDEARLAVQSAALRRVLGERDLEGDCLNAGSGEGLYAAFLEHSPKLRRIVHMDVDAHPVAAEFAGERHSEVVGSVTAIPFPDANFGACLCTEVMEHVSNDEIGFYELARVVAPGGLLLITTPTPLAPFDPSHVREGYTLEQMRTRLERHGFEVMESTFCFHWAMRALLVTWRWQFETLGKKRRSVMPRFIVRFAGWIDCVLPFGKPWDLVVLARRVGL